MELSTGIPSLFVSITGEMLDQSVTMSIKYPPTLRAVYLLSVKQTSHSLSHYLDACGTVAWMECKHSPILLL